MCGISRIPRQPGRRGFAWQFIHDTTAAASVAGDLHRPLIRVLAELSDAPEAILVHAAYDQTRGWQWVTEPL